MIIFFLSAVRSTVRHAIHMHFDISANALEIRVVQSPKCVDRRAVDCTLRIRYNFNIANTVFGIFEHKCSLRDTVFLTAKF
jgi:hypothetical protein